MAMAADKKRILVTSALPYANGSIHLGHLVEYIQTDIFVRFLKLTGKNAVYCCADDTHGTPIQIKADEMGIKPEQLIERFHKEHLEDFNSFLISFDSYYSTNSSENKKYADQIFNALKEKGLIYKKEVENFFDEKQQRFLPDRYVKGECPKCGAKDQYGDVCEKCNATYKPTDLISPYSTISKTKPIRKKSEHYFFRLSALSGKIDKWLTGNKKLQPKIVNSVRTWIKEGLQDWDISRDGPYFGFKIPGEADKYYYVWLDAPIGYIASTQNYCKQNNLDAEKDYWKNDESAIIHFIGKDIIYFHFLFWPAMLMESGFNLPEMEVVHGFLTVNGEKMSKSRGTFLTARDFLKKYNPEYLRYYYAKLLSRKMSDIDLDFKDFRNSVNNELVANIGNFCYRTLSYLEKNFGSEFTAIEEDEKLFGGIIRITEQIKADYNDVNFKSAVQNILKVSSIGNKYFQDSEPWKLIKEDREKTQRIIGSCVNIVKILGIAAQPILPDFFEKLRKQLDIKDLGWKDVNFSLKKHKTGRPEILFEKMELAEQESFPLNLRVAEIMQAENHPDADKLYILKVDLGAEKRQLVAGLKSHYKKEELKGKKIVVVSNLKPAKLRGIKSEGMLLAAEDRENVGLLTVDAKPGTGITVENHTTLSSQIKYGDFTRVKLKAVHGKAFFKGIPLKAGSKEVLVEKVKQGKIR
ncbi:methionine--tRNA ligase [Candidatus Woesearchaeota archaeon]|nr:methionine--tRNA ligase [Candidatus Woesearchaeota archaeon]